MGSRGGTPRARGWQRRRAGATPTVRDLDELDRPEEYFRPPPSKAKDFLGAAMTVAIIGTIFLSVTYNLAGPCLAAPAPRPGAGGCSGVAAVASHIRGVATLCVIGCAAVAVAAFIWYMARGYRRNGQAGEGPAR